MSTLLKIKLQDMLPSKTNGMLLKNIYNAKNTIVTTAKCEVLKLTKKTRSLMKKISKVLSPKQIVEAIKQRAKKFLNKVSVHNNFDTIINKYYTPEQQERIEKDLLKVFNEMERIVYNNKQ